MPRTLEGRVVYDREEHKFVARDVLRILPHIYLQELTLPQAIHFATELLVYQVKLFARIQEYYQVDQVGVVGLLESFFEILKSVREISAAFGNLFLQNFKDRVALIVGIFGKD